MLLGQRLRMVGRLIVGGGAMFEKCVVCGAGAGLAGARRTGFIAASEAGLAPQADRPWLSGSAATAWLCGACAGRLRAEDAEALKRESERVARQLQQVAEEAFDKALSEHSGPEDPVAHSAWSWLRLHEGAEARVAFQGVVDGHIYREEAVWQIGPPICLDPIVWRLPIEYFWRNCHAHLALPPKGIGGVALKPSTYAAYSPTDLFRQRGHHEVDVSENELTYRIGFSEKSTESDGGMTWSFPQGDAQAIKYWQTYVFQLV